MKPVSRECARSDRDCRDCSFRNCNCTCHGRSDKNWREFLKEHNKRRYYMGQSKNGIWFVMDRGTLSNPSTRKIAECHHRIDAYRLTQALNKGNK